MSIAPFRDRVRVVRITRTLRSVEDRQEISAMIFRLKTGSRVTLSDPEATDAQKLKCRLMRDEISRRIKWHGEKLGPEEWLVMFSAADRGSHVVDGIETGTRVVLGGVREDKEPSAEEAGRHIEMMYAFAAERGVMLE
jgi:hypothetical protein